MGQQIQCSPCKCKDRGSDTQNTRMTLCQSSYSETEGRLESPSELRAHNPATWEYTVTNTQDCTLTLKCATLHTHAHILTRNQTQTHTNK